MGSEWDRCAHWIQAAIDADPAGLPIEQVRAEIEAGRADFWPGAHSAAVCGLMQPLGIREYHIWLAGGDLGELRIMEEHATAHAIALGCERMVIHGRKGWLRALPGYETGRTIRKEL